MRRLVALWIFAAAICVAAWANWNDTSTGIDLTKLPAFPLAKVRSGLLKDGEQVRFDGLSATMSGPLGGLTVDEVILRGTAKSGKAWAAYFGWSAFNQVFRGDLDGNGTQDYVIIGGAIGNGRRAPPGWITVLLMDERGLPSPYEAPLYDELGPRHVVDERHDGRAQLALSSYDEDPWDGRAPPFCSGRWTTRLYEASNLDWVETAGTAQGPTFPFIHRWTYGPNCDPKAQPLIGNERIELEKDGPAVTSARIAEVGRDRWVKLSPSDCEGFAIGTVVYDELSQREISLDSGSGYADRLLDQIRADKADVTLRGVHNDCRANLLWATR